MRKRNNIYTYFLFIALLFLILNSAMRLLPGATGFIVSVTSVRHGASLKSSTDKVNHKKHDVLDHINNDQATIFLNNIYDAAAYNASLKQRSLIDADTVLSCCTTRIVDIKNATQSALDVPGNSQKILLLFPFHSFW